MVAKLSLLFGALFFVLVLATDPAADWPSILLRTYDAAPTGWMLVLDPSTNAFFTWRPDPVITAIVGSGAEAATRIGISSGILFIIGFSLYLHLLAKHRQGGLPASVLAAAVLTLFIWCCLGFDYPALSRIMWVPWLVLSAIGVVQLSGTTFLVSIAMYLFLSWRLAAAAQQAAIPLLALAWLLYLQAAESSAELRRRHSALAPLLFLVPLLCVVLEIAWRPPLPAFDYPGLSHVVPDDGIEGVTRPLIGEAAPIPYIDRDAVRSIFSQPSLLLLLMVLITARGARGLRRIPAHLGAFLAAAGLVWSTVLTEPAALIGPLAALGRTVPGLSFLPIEALTYLCAATLLIAALVREGRAALIAPALIVLHLGTALARNVPPLEAGLLLDRDALQVSAAIRAHPAGRIITEPVLISPSFAVLRHAGPEAALRAAGDSTLIELPLNGLIPVITASHAAEPRSTQRMADGKPNTRWSAKRGTQAGDEWIRITFPRREIAGIVLGVGEYSADFPRAFVIEQCDLSYPIRLYPRGWAAASPRWEGPVHLTALGYPYFGWQSDVRVVFPGPISVSCLKISQVGVTPNFDWSVAEVSLLVPGA